MERRELLEKLRAQIHTDGYDMSVGEWIALYKQDELDLHPELHKFEEWSDSLPVPPDMSWRRRSRRSLYLGAGGGYEGSAPGGNFHSAGKCLLFPSEGKTNSKKFFNP